jgi:hypothetical protein
VDADFFPNICGYQRNSLSAHSSKTNWKRNMTFFLSWLSLFAVILVAFWGFWREDEKKSFW